MLTPLDEAEGEWSFYRQETRHTRLKRHMDCEHTIDGGEPYRYQVGKIVGATRLFQRYDCEFCARSDNSY